MRIIMPTIITDAMLTSSTLTEDDYAVWLVGTTFAEDEYCIVIGTTHKVYRSIQAANTGNDPAADDGTWWQEIGATNRWKPFDNKTSAQATGTTSITYVFDNLGMVDGVALLGLAAETARLVITDDGEDVYDQTISLTDTGIVFDWYTFFFEPRTFSSKLIFPNVPAYFEATYTITVAGTGTVKLGQLILGRDYEIGTTIHGSGLGLSDFSRKDRDGFGNAILVEGQFAQTVDFDAKIYTRSADRVFKLLASRRASPTVYYAGEDTDKFSTTVFGYFEDFSILLSTPVLSDINIEVQELT